MDLLQLHLDSETDFKILKQSSYIERLKIPCTKPDNSLKWIFKKIRCAANSVKFFIFLDHCSKEEKKAQLITWSKTWIQNREKQKEQKTHKNCKMLKFPYNILKISYHFILTKNSIRHYKETEIPFNWKICTFGNPVLKG